MWSLKQSVERDGGEQEEEAKEEEEQQEEEEAKEEAAYNTEEGKKQVLTSKLILRAVAAVQRHIAFPNIAALSKRGMDVPYEFQCELCQRDDGNGDRHHQICLVHEHDNIVFTYNYHIRWSESPMGDCVPGDYLRITGVLFYFAESLCQECFYMLQRKSLKRNTDTFGDTFDDVINVPWIQSQKWVLDIVSPRRKSLHEWIRRLLFPVLLGERDVISLLRFIEVDFEQVATELE